MRGHAEIAGFLVNSRNVRRHTNSAATDAAWIMAFGIEEAMVANHLRDTMNVIDPKFSTSDDIVKAWSNQILYKLKMQRARMLDVRVFLDSPDMLVAHLIRRAK